MRRGKLTGGAISSIGKSLVPMGEGVCGEEERRKWEERKPDGDG